MSSEGITAKVFRFPRPASPPAARSIHLIDIENLIGGTKFSEGDVAAVAQRYKALAGVGEDDFVVVASSHHTALATWFGWPDARRLVRSGVDGADLALIEVIERENLAMRFDRVVIASGDGIFAVPAAKLQQREVEVTIVSRPEFLSRALRLASRDIRILDSEPDLGPVIAARVA
jgi:hypothetical protein